MIKCFIFSSTAQTESATMSVQLHAVGVAMPTTGRWRVPLVVVLEVVDPVATVTTTQSMGSVKSCKPGTTAYFCLLLSVSLSKNGVQFWELVA